MEKCFGPVTRIRNEKLTSNDEFIHFGHEKALITEQHGCASFVEFRCQENSTRSHHLATRRIVDLNAIGVRCVLQMSEPSENAASWHKVHAA